jgi:dTDP-4-dehydrorhamnose 3,5-epimerase
MATSSRDEPAEPQPPSAPQKVGLPATLISAVAAGHSGAARRGLAIRGRPAHGPSSGSRFPMQLKPTSLPGVVEIVPIRHGDARGYFAETFRADWFEKNVAPFVFVQENESLSRQAGLVRGLHFQSAPFAQGKLVRCASGAIFDVAVDIRTGSPHFGRWVGVTLSAAEGNQLWVPPGFLHGFCTLTGEVVVSYKVTAYYSRDDDRGVRWDDPDIGIRWPDIADSALMSEKDRRQPSLAELPGYFSYQGER